MTDKFNFIEIYDNVFSKDYCEELVKILEDRSAKKLTNTRQETEEVSKLQKEDEFLFMEQMDMMHCSNNLYLTFNKNFWSIAYKQYADKYNIVRDLAEHSIYGMKLQKTKPGQGYHGWHCENADRSTAHRLLAYTVYLNNNFEAGETEFLYQQKRVVPKQGSVLLFPAAFTHTHRGNPPIGGNKYILTGWVEF